MSQDTYYEAAIEKSLFDGRFTPASVIVTLSIALALYNSLEIVLLISSTFKRWRGLYFWSLTLCNLGIFSYTLGMMLAYFSLSVFWVDELLIDGGWVLMITCQSLVLYSRLGLILESTKILRAVKWMIILNAMLIQGTVIIFDWAKAYSHNPAFAEGYYYLEHIQMTVITIQELIISGLYVWKTVALLKVISKAETRSMIWQLLMINVIIIAMDVSIQIL